MPVPTYGAAPLAKTFLLARGLSLIAMLSIVGLTANFVSQIVSTNVSPPREIVGTLVVTCLATLYTLLSLPLFYSPSSSSSHLTLLILTGLDSLLLLTFTITSVLLGKPLSFLSCPTIASQSSAANASTTYQFTTALVDGVTAAAKGQTLQLGQLAGSTRLNCYEAKAVWGMCVGLCVCFFVSASVLPILWWKGRKAAGVAEKGGV